MEDCSRRPSLVTFSHNESLYVASAKSSSIAALNTVALNSLQPTPAKLTVVLTMGTRVGDGVGDGVGALVVGAGVVGEAVGYWVGALVVGAGVVGDAVGWPGVTVGTG